jgi:hypothetical protein
MTTRPSWPGHLRASEMNPEDRKALEQHLDRIRQRDEEMTGIRFWPPLNPDPDCHACGGRGYSSAGGSVGRCRCNHAR